MRLAWHGDRDGAEQILRTPADADDGQAASSWATCWPSAATWTRCAPGPPPGLGFAGGYLPGLLTKQGRAEEAERLERSGLNPDGSICWRVIDACSGPVTVLQRRERLRRSAISGVPVPAARRNYQG